MVYYVKGFFEVTVQEVKFSKKQQFFFRKIQYETYILWHH